MANSVCICNQCKSEFFTKNSRINRAKSIAAPLYCGIVCAGLARRNPDKLTGDAQKLSKREYDFNYRLKNRESIIAKKKDHYKKNRDEIEAKQKIYRKENMRRHVAYCQRPEYRAWKADYDRKFLAKKNFGEFAEAVLLLRDIELEIDTKATRYEIYSTNGTLNKSQNRKRML